MDYFIHVAVYTELFILLGVSYRLLIGTTGLFAVCFAAFVGIGAYSSVFLQMKLHWTFVPATIVAMLATMVVSLTIAIPAVRVHWDYFVMLSLALQYVFYQIFASWDAFTGAGIGITNIPHPSILGITFQSKVSFLVLTTIVLAVVLPLTHWLDRSPFGHVLKAMQEDEIAIKALGRDTSRLKIYIIAITAALMALAGSIYAGYFTVIIPANFGIHMAFLIAIIPLVGGVQKMWGSVAGAILIIAFPEALRFLPTMPPSYTGIVREMIFGAVLVILMLFRPEGLFGTIRLGRKVQPRLGSQAASPQA